MRTLRLNLVTLRTATVIAGAVGAVLFFSSLALAAPGEVTTDAATNLTAGNATLNGQTGFDAATQTSFWVSTSTFSTADPNVLPPGAYSVVVPSGIASSSPFTANLTDAVGLTVTASTTYHYVAWANNGTSWTPGAIVTFATLPAAPTVTGISPTTGTTTGGTSVTITGTDLTGATGVSFGANPATSFTVDSDTQITATSPAGAAGPVDVTVTTTGGTSAIGAGSVFTYVAAPVVILAPAISNITVSNVASTSATITWSTDLPATSQVAYGTTTGYGSSSTYNGTASTTHSTTLTGLSEGTLYHFAVSSGNVTATTTSSDNTFITQSTSSSTPLAVNSITPGSTTATANGLFSNGWSWTMRLTVPDNEDAFRMLFSDWSGSAGTFQGDNNVRISSVQSSNASTTSSGIISPDNNYGAWMYLTGDASLGTAGRQIDVLIEVRIPVGTAAGSYTANFSANSVPQTATSTTI